ncbi:unnamed protein product [Spirodela intermedia]|uniref:Uncharacterized protein n=2 Tax=Spirodela intermedia TaxID=51605 RepID=A0A7I8LAN5_SPIIN|nr:unnamed protein product [Spirodela intermedia]CAA6669858.1 unnamed protein product [Spirodela intermedia]CAA7406832.1 unnamed protein product [Spirodela intermedia]
MQLLRRISKRIFLRLHQRPFSRCFFSLYLYSRT